MRNASPLPEGKIPIHVLRQILSATSKRNLVVGPQIGVDVGVTKSRGKYIVSSSDPITGTEKRMAWHAVNVSANDVATSGIMPDTINVVALFPEKTTSSQIRKFMGEINASAEQLGITVAGGHTEITPGLNRSIVVVTAFGSGERFTTAANGRSGDAILMTKSAGIEGTSIIAQLNGVKTLLPRKVTSRGERLFNRLSILTEAKIAFETGLVHAMHDVTEGGVIGAAFEMSLASNLGLEIESDKIEVDESTGKICQAINVDPLTLLGSGSLLISCAQEDTSDIISSIARRGIQCSAIGRFTSREERHIFRNEQRERLKESSIQDGLWAALKKYS